MLFVILMIERMKAVFQVAGLIHSLDSDENSFILQA